MKYFTVAFLALAVLCIVVDLGKVFFFTYCITKYLIFCNFQLKAKKYRKMWLVASTKLAKNTATWTSLAPKPIARSKIPLDLIADVYLKFSLKHFKCYVVLVQ